MADKPESAPEKEKEEAAAPAAPTASGGIKAWLPLIITVALMPVLAYAMTSFVLLPRLQKGLGITVQAKSVDTHSKSKKEKGEAKKETVLMNKLLVNVSGTMGARYLLVSLSIVGNGADFKEVMESHDAQLKDAAQGILATKTLADLEKPGARNLIRTELINGFNNILGDSLVEEMYLTEFAIQ